MKRLMHMISNSLMLALMLLCSIPLNVHAANANYVDLGTVSEIATNYVKWAEIYRISNFDMEPHYSPNSTGKNERVLIIDDLGIIYSNADLQAHGVSLYYIKPSTSATEMVDQWKRASSLFCALIHGDPWKYSDDTLETIKTEAESILNELNKTMSDFHDILLNGGKMSFHQSQNLYFYLFYYDGQWMISAQ